MDKLREFFKNNDVRIGEGKDFTVRPPVYYSSLNEAFYHYFLTFRDKKETYHFILDIHSWTRESLSFNFTGSNSNIVSAILGFHRFMELLLKDILRRINPFLAVKFLEKEEELFQFFDNQINADTVKTIEFSETLKRFKYAFKHFDKTSDVYNIHLKQYEFLVSPESFETLIILAEWRNRIMHNGTTLPNLFAFEYLVTQRLVQLIDQIVKAEQKYLGDYLPHYFETKTGIRIIDEILKINFKFTDFNDPQKSENLAIGLLKLGHLKEIGRVTFHQDFLIRENKSFWEPYYENPIGRAERFAELERDNKDFFNLCFCNCCGANTLVVYRQEYLDIFSKKNEFFSWLRCYNCDYSLKNNVGDPYFFDLSTIPLFATK